jgi:hypothetical protein
VTESQLALLCALAAFVSGAIPFAVWLTRVIAHSDVRAVGDGNPGAGNAFRAGGWRVGVPALVLEVGKAGAGGCGQVSGREQLGSVLRVRPIGVRSRPSSSSGEARPSRSPLAPGRD